MFALEPFSSQWQVSGPVHTALPSSAGPAVWARRGAALCSLWTPAGEVGSLPCTQRSLGPLKPHPHPLGWSPSPAGCTPRAITASGGRGRTTFTALGNKLDKEPTTASKPAEAGGEHVVRSLRRTSPAETMTLHFWPRDCEGTNLPFKPLTLWDFVKVAPATYGREAARLPYCRTVCAVGFS